MPKVLIAVALAGSIGLHWTILQMVAWTGMVVAYSQHASIGEALAKTFDGKHPCNLCNSISKARKSEKKSDTPFEVKRLKFVNAPVAYVFVAPQDFYVVNCGEDGANPSSLEPPTPPPRPS